MSQYHVIGVMSGSSLDGLDVCWCEFEDVKSNWSHKVLHSSTITLPDTLKKELANSDKLQPKELSHLDLKYGKWIGRELNQFICSSGHKPDLIGIHGHTVFHEPKTKGISLQIGSGKVIRDISGVEVVDNFRMKDIALGGQGAPLVPVGEHFIYPEYDTFLNLGGICNISIHTQNNIQAWDIAPCNQVLNHFAQLKSLPYDHGGQLAKSGNVDANWLKALHSLDYFKLPPPKSLSNQWTKKVLEGSPAKVENALCTYTQFLAEVISEPLIAAESTSKSMLISGGGAFNNTLIEALAKELNTQVSLTIPDEQVVAFKEAIIFAFLGLLRKLNIPNVYASVTGAQRDSVSGDLHTVG